jgi:hypothetical protein
MAQRPEATHVAGFHTWKSLGRIVNSGAKGIAILAPLALKRDKHDSSDSSPPEEDDDSIVRFRVHCSRAQAPSARPKQVQLV